MKKYILLLVVTVTLGAIPLFLQYGEYIMYTDMAKQEIPFIIETKRMLASGTPFWSWNTYYGDNFWAGYAFYTLTSPFAWLLCLLPYGWVMKGLFPVLLLKYVCAFLASWAYLRKMSVTRETALTGGLLYALSSYTICNSYYFHFFEPLIVFPLLLIAVERFLRHERYASTGLIVMSFLTAFVNYYFCVCSLLAALLYVGCRLCSRQVSIRPRRVALGVVLVLAGVAMDAVILLPVYYHLSGAPRSGHIDFGFWGVRAALSYGFERLRTLFMPQILEQPTALFKGAAGWESRAVCLPVLGMLPALLYCWRHRRDWLTVLIVILVALLLTPLNSLFSMGTNPTYTRWLYTLCLILTLATCRWMDEGRGITVRQVGWYSLWVVVLFAASVIRGRNAEAMKDILPHEQKSIIFSGYALVLCVGLLLLYCYARKQQNRRLPLYIAVAAAVQIGVFHTIRSDAYFERVGDRNVLHLVRDYLTDNHLPRHDGDMHYRTLFSSGYYENLPLQTNRAGLNSSHSIQNNAIRRLMNAVDSTNNLYRICAGENCNRRSFYALMSVRDIVAYDDAYPPFDKHGLSITPKERGDGYTLYSNKDYIPMGFTYDTYVEEALIDTLNARSPKPDIPLQLLSSIAAPKSEEHFFSQHLRHGRLLDTGPTAREAILDSLVKARRRHVAREFRGTTTGFSSSISLPKESVVFYSVPADKGFTASIDGKETPIHACNLGLSAVYVPKGTHRVEFRFVPRGLREGALISLVLLLTAVGICILERRKGAHPRI